jgi:hypothetical protein
MLRYFAQAGRRENKGPLEAPLGRGGFGARNPDVFDLLRADLVYARPVGGLQVRANQRIAARPGECG